MRKYLAVVLLIFTLGLLASCGPKQGSGKEDEEIGAVIAALESGGQAVSLERMEKGILNGDRYRLALDGGTEVVLYQYATPQGAQNDAGCIDKSGCSIAFEQGGEGTAFQIDWVSVPHYYLYRSLIVEYVGTDERILSALEGLCGACFAGVEQT